MALFLFFLSNFRVDRNKYQIHIPLPPKIDPTVTMMQVNHHHDIVFIVIITPSYCHHRYSDSCRHRSRNLVFSFSFFITICLNTLEVYLIMSESLLSSFSLWLESSPLLVMVVFFFLFSHAISFLCEFDGSNPARGAPATPALEVGTFWNLEGKTKCGRDHEAELLVH